eukprot:1282256-Amphidinium_carterae.1
MIWEIASPRRDSGCVSWYYQSSGCMGLWNDAWKHHLTLFSIPKEFRKQSWINVFPRFQSIYKKHGQAAIAE